MLSVLETSVDSNEREMKAVLELLFGSKTLLTNKCVTLHVDNENVAIIMKKGSGKMRFHHYALSVFNFCKENNITLNVVSIPRSINSFADMLCIPMIFNHM